MVDRRAARRSLRPTASSAASCAVVEYEVSPAHLRTVQIQFSAPVSSDSVLLVARRAAFRLPVCAIPTATILVAPWNLKRLECSINCHDLFVRPFKMFIIVFAPPLSFSLSYIHTHAAFGRLWSHTGADLPPGSKNECALLSEAFLGSFRGIRIVDSVVYSQPEISSWRTSPTPRTTSPHFLSFKVSSASCARTERTDGRTTTLGGMCRCCELAEALLHAAVLETFLMEACFAHPLL
jgi:hypothetical protein